MASPISVQDPDVFPATTMFLAVVPPEQWMVAWVSVTCQPHFSPVMMPPVQPLSPLCTQRRQ
ncbi:hypothetical protein [Streptomyces sp. NPDC055681]